MLRLGVYCLWIVLVMNNSDSEFEESRSIRSEVREGVQTIHRGSHDLIWLHLG